MEAAVCERQAASAPGYAVTEREIQVEKNTPVDVELVLVPLGGSPVVGE